MTFFLGNFAKGYIFKIIKGFLSDSIFFYLKSILKRK